MYQPWLVWLSGLSARLGAKGLLVSLPGRAHAWVAGQVPSRGCRRGNHALMFLSLSLSLPPPLSKNKKIKNLKKDKCTESLIFLLTCNSKCLKTMGKNLNYKSKQNY